MLKKEARKSRYLSKVGLGSILRMLQNFGWKAFKMHLLKAKVSERGLERSLEGACSPSTARRITVLPTDRITV